MQRSIRSLAFFESRFKKLLVLAFSILIETLPKRLCVCVCMIYLKSRERDGYINEYNERREERNKASGRLITKTRENQIKL